MPFLDNLQSLRVLACVMAAVGACCAIAHADTGIVSWNAFSKQFIDAPTFNLLPLPGAVEYRAVVKYGDKTLSVASETPRISLSRIWSRVPRKAFSLTVEWVDKDGKIIQSETSARLRAPDWRGMREPAENWRAAADRNIEYLLDVAENGKATYREPGVPVFIWSCASPDVNSPNGAGVSYPCITINNYIWALTSHAASGGKHAKEAIKLARKCADWALKNRLPEDCALPLFPYSTIVNGQFGGAVEGTSVNLMRACWFAVGMVDIYAATKDGRYLDYAKHIANVAVKFQNPDGSFPYRLDPKTGKVIEQYACNAIEFTTLVDALEAHGYDRALAKASRRAVDWMVAYVCTTHHWQAAYEDVGAVQPYSNLSQMQALPLIRYLCKHRDEDPGYVKLAVSLNRWVEDQFVVFGPESDAYSVHIKGPQVFEQFICWAPMEGHTGNWIESLIALHKATGDKTYLEKAMAAGNAICAQQFDNGAFSTWSVRHLENGKTVPEKDPGGNWYNSNAFADRGLYVLDSYVRSEPVHRLLGK